MNVKVCVLKTDGTNCDAETVFAFKQAGAQVDLVTLYQLKQKKELLHRYNILALPGGFSYGDDIASGKLFALELLLFLKDELQKFVEDKKLIMGICNGFQILVKMGLLPFHTLEQQQVTLTDNLSGKFECRWVDMVVQKSNCVFTKSLEGKTITLPIAHAEGRFFTDELVAQQVLEQQMVPLTYEGLNPNGSLNNIAGLCDASGRVFGLMPHPERFIKKEHLPQWRRNNVIPWGNSFFKDAVNYF